jgi:hypothetical protein
MTEPEANQQKAFQFFDSNKVGKPMETPAKVNNQAYIKIGNNDALPSINHSSFKPMNNYKSILSKLVNKPSPLKSYQADDRLLVSVQKSDNTSKSRSKSRSRIPRVVDVFEIYDRKKLIRNSRLDNRSIMEQKKLV